MGYQTGTCENVYNIGNVTDSGEDTKVPARNAAGQIIGELNIDTSTGAEPQTNDYLHKPSGASPYVGSIASGSLGTHLYTVDSTTTGKTLLLTRLKSWVNSHSGQDYKNWKRDSTINDGYPVFDL
jgi:hypothetical protein